MSGTIRRALALLCPLLAAAPQSMAWEHDWTVLTLTRNGLWGVASDSSQSKAIFEAIKACMAMAGPSTGCGAQLIATQGGWIVANLCGDHPVIATGRNLSDVEHEALNREISLQLLYVPNLPPCRRVVTIDSAGAMVLPISINERIGAPANASAR